MTPDEILAFWQAFHARYQNGQGPERKGQAMFNALNDVAPVLADMIRGTHADPFYRDDSERIYRFRSEIGV